MKKYISIFWILILFAGCEEFQPVFTGDYPLPEPEKIYTDQDFQKITPIKELAARYEYGKGQAVLISDNVVISGRVITDDRPGNFYKTLYIQDETASIEIKVGRNGLYNEYKRGQKIYVDCSGLYVGMYGYDSEDGAGMIQIGHADPTGEYETSYLESALIVDNHIFKGELGEAPAPVVLSDAELPSKTSTAANNKYVGALVTLNDLTYDDEVFVLMYLNSNLDKDAATNRIFLSSGKSWDVTSWAMSKGKMGTYLESGIWDNARVGSGKNQYERLSELRTIDKDGDGLPDGGLYPTIERAAYSVSQYFRTPGGKQIQIRTSGYSKFGDTEIDPDVLSGDKTLNATGIFTMYEGSPQIVLIDIDGIEVNE